MKLSTRGDYAARVLLELSLAEGPRALSVHDLAQRTRISPKYLEQIMTRLRSAQIVKKPPWCPRRLRAGKRSARRYGRRGHSGDGWPPVAEPLREPILPRAVPHVSVPERRPMRPQGALARRSGCHRRCPGQHHLCGPGRTPAKRPRDRTRNVLHLVMPSIVLSFAMHCACTCPRGAGA